MISQHITRDHIVFRIDALPLVEAISKACIKQEIERINNRIAALLGFMEEVPPSDFDRVRIIQELAELKKKRRNAGKLLKFKSYLVSNLLHRLWIDRLQSANRSTARIIYDSMSITMPVPPTNETVQHSFACGRVADGMAC